MDMSKPLVFISHITEEKEIAIAFKELIEGSWHSPNFVDTLHNAI